MIDPELQIALDAHEILNGIFKEVHREDHPQAVRSYVYRVQMRLSQRISEVAFGEPHEDPR